MKKIFSVILAVVLLVNSINPTITEARSLPNSQEDVADRIAEIAIDNYDKYGVLPSVCVAQAFIESTLGEHKSNTHNYFGIRSGAVGYDSLESGVIAYLKIINNGCYDGAVFNKSYESSISHILKGGYCEPVGNYYSNAVWSIKTYDFTKYDRQLKKIQEQKRKVKKKRKEKEKELKRKNKWTKKYTFVYDPTVPANKVMVDKNIIHGGVISAYADDVVIISDVIPGSTGYEIRTNIKNLDGCETYIMVYENAVG